MRRTPAREKGKPPLSLPVPSKHRIMKSRQKAFHKTGNSQSGSLAKVYLAHEGDRK
jgi:hypothetical protein